MNVIDIIETTVDNIRYTKSITNIVDNANGTYTVSTSDTKDLANGDYVQILNTTGFTASNYKISSLVTDTSFNITKAAGTAIPGTFGTWKANAPYFMKGRWTEITRELIDKSQSSTYRKQRFDLITLILPIQSSQDYKRDQLTKDVPSLEIYFFTPTDERKNTDWRVDNTYPILEALRNRFNDEFKIVVIGEMDIEDEFNPHMDGRAYVFSEPVDAWVDRYSNLKIQDIC